MTIGGDKNLASITGVASGKSFNISDIFALTTMIQYLLIQDLDNFIEYKYHKKFLKATIYLLHSSSSYPK